MGASGVFEILSCTGNTVRAKYLSTRHLLAALTGNPRPGVSYEQYFGKQQDHPSARVPPGGSVLDLFAAPPIIGVETNLVLANAPTAARPSQQAVTVLPNGLGIDLVKRGHEVRKLLFAGFGLRIAQSTYDAEEVLQEVYRGILARNRGRCPFDAKKSSFGHYVHMVCECVLNNYHRKKRREREIEQVGMIAPSSMQDDAGPSGMVDAASVADRMVSSDAEPTDAVQGMDDAIQRLQAHVDRKRAAGLTIDAFSVRIAEMLYTGKNRREIADEIGVSQARVASAILSLREHVRDW